MWKRDNSSGAKKKNEFIPGVDKLRSKLLFFPSFSTLLICQVSKDQTAMIAANYKQDKKGLAKKN